MVSQEVISALEVLHKELEKLEPAIKHVETAQQVTQIVKGIPQKHLDLLKEVKDGDAKHKAELKDIFSKELSGLSDESKKLQRITSEIQEQAIADQKALSKLKDRIEGFHERVEKINFPERLDKLDANVAGIMAAIQAVQSRLNSLDQNISVRLKTIHDYQKETRSSFQTALEQTKTTLEEAVDKASQRQQIFTYITWALLAIALFKLS